MEQWYIYNEDMAKTIVDIAKKHVPSGLGKPLISQCSPFNFDPYISFSGDSEKLFKTDKLFFDKLEKFRTNTAKQIHDNLLKVIDRNIADCAKDWKKDGDNEARLDELKTHIVEQVQHHGAAMQDTAFKIANTYLQGVKAGKLAETKYKTKIVKGSIKTVLMGASVVVAGASAVVSHGVTTPAIFVAAWGTYKSGKQTFETYQAWGKSVDDFEATINKTIKILKDKYYSIDPKTLEPHIKQGTLDWSEVKAKAADEFLALRVKSLKSLEPDIKHLERHVAMGFLELSRGGKELKKMEDSLHVMQEENNKARAEINARKNQVPSGLVSAILKKLDTADKHLAFERSQFPVYLKKSEEIEKKLKTIQEVNIPEYEEICTDLKAKRSKWVKKSSWPMKATPVVISAACGDIHGLTIAGADQIGEAVRMSVEAMTGVGEIALEQAKHK